MMGKKEAQEPGEGSETKPTASTGSTSQKERALARSKTDDFPPYEPTGDQVFDSFVDYKGLADHNLSLLVLALTNSNQPNNMGI